MGQVQALAAVDLGVQVVMIRRPDQVGIASVSSLEAAVHACRQKMATGDQ